MVYGACMSVTLPNITSGRLDAIDQENLVSYTRSFLILTPLQIDYADYVDYPRDAQRDVLSNEVPLGRLSCCCVFCEEGVFSPSRQQASTVTKLVPEACAGYCEYPF
jgi:hypothetical protein